MFECVIKLIKKEVVRNGLCEKEARRIKALYAKSGVKVEIRKASK